MSVTVTSLSVFVHGLSVSLQGLLVVNFPYPRTETGKVSDGPKKVTALFGAFTDRPAKVTDSVVCFPAQPVCHHVQSGSLCDKPDTDRPVVLTNKTGSVTDRTLS